MIGKDKAKVKVGNMTTTVELRNLRLLDQNAEDEPSVERSTHYVPEDAVNPEIHLLGMTGDEALENLTKYLDSAVLAGLGQVYVIHGKGTGTLRRILTGYLKEHKDVASLRLGNWNEGGAGVTIVKLKK